MSEITIFTRRGGELSKRIKLGDDGRLVITPAAAMTKGSARRAPIADVRELAAVIERLECNEAIALGALRTDLPDQVRVVTKDKLNGAAGAAGLIARTSDFICYQQRQSAFALLDLDLKGMPSVVADRLTALGGFWEALVAALPALRDIGRVVRRSTSAGLRHTDTGEMLDGSGGTHIFITAQDGGDVERFLKTLHERCWLSGYGWIMLSKAGTMLERSIVDRSVGAPERLVFEAAPILTPPLAQDAESRRPIATEGALLDTLAACPPLTAAERATLDQLVTEAKQKAQPEADKVRAAYVDKRAEALAKRKNITKEEAVRVIESLCRGVLLPDVELFFVDKKLKGCTVGDVLNDPERFEKKALADPIEGTSYGRTTAMVMRRRDDGRPWIKSFAHGGVSYSLERAAAEAPPPRSLDEAHAVFRKRLGDDYDTASGVSLHDFHAYMPMHSYIFMPTREAWPASSVNNRIPPIMQGGKSITASAWLDKNRSVEQMTWAPGQDVIICDRLVSEGGWIERPGVSCLNLYRQPTIEMGNAAEAGPWLEHVRKVYPDDADAIIMRLAYKVQHPGDKINHGLVLGGSPGIGKDTMLEPVKDAIGPWNFIEISPHHMLGRFNGFAKSVILRISEARDLGDVDRFQFHERLKIYQAAPPDVSRIDEKNLREYYVFNCCFVIITTNRKDSLYLPADDRRNYVAWSNLEKEDFNDDYWRSVWGWYKHGGIGHVAAYLAALDVTAFDPKAPPPKTPVFWEIVDLNSAPENDELADALDSLAEKKDAQGNPIRPDAVTIEQIVDAVSADGSPGSLYAWLTDRRNRRSIPHRLEQCGYVSVRNGSCKDRRWVIGGTRHVVYARAELCIRDRHAAVEELVRANEKPQGQ